MAERCGGWLRIQGRGTQKPDPLHRSGELEGSDLPSLSFLLCSVSDNGVDVQGAERTRCDPGCETSPTRGLMRQQADRTRS